MSSNLEAMPEATPGETVRQKLSAAIAVATLGIVFGDIGTSPLYTLKTCFTAAHVDPTQRNVIGIISALVWTLVAVVCIKYVTFVMQIDFNGEGGIFALLARLMPAPLKGTLPTLGAIALIGVVGGATLLGDGIITPAISVLSAVEGLSGITPAAIVWEVPLTVAILIGLFWIQSRGTQKIGIVFGPIMVLWFAMIALAGGLAIAREPQVVAALSPVPAIWFLTHHGIFGFLVLGGTVLCVTGVEALYADMSHFGRGPIRWTWYCVVFPALLLNYLGQGAAVLEEPANLNNAFYSLTPGWTLFPMILLATAATVIAAQALISGAFTVVEQGIALNLVPRMRVLHTSNRYPGQVFVPAVNVALAIGCVLLVLAFKTSDALAAAYGLAVSLTMGATTILYVAVLRRVLKWNPFVAYGLFVAFIVLDGSFVLAGLAKIPAGGWIPLAIGAVLTFLASTWYDGRARLLASLSSYSVPLEQFNAEVKADGARTIEGTAVFLTGDPDGIPYILRHHWVRVQALNERIVLLRLLRASEPYVSDKERVSIVELSDRLIRIEAKFGFMELPDLKPVIASCKMKGLHIDGDKTAYFAASPQIVRGDKPRMPAIRRWLFDVMQKLSSSLPRDLHIAPDQLVELGVEVRL